MSPAAHSDRVNQDQRTLLTVTRTFADGHVETDRHIWEGYTPAQAWRARRDCRESGGGKWDAVDRRGLALTITTPTTGAVEVLRFTEYEPTS